MKRFFRSLKTENMPKKVMAVKVLQGIQFEITYINIAIQSGRTVIIQGWRRMNKKNILENL